MELAGGMSRYPVEIDLRGRLAVVVGGGEVALRRTRGLADAGARVVVVAPRLAEGFAGLAVTIRRRRYHDGDLAGAWFAHAATGDPAVNAAVAAEAERAGIWCVRADDAAASAVHMPAVTRHGDITVAVTAGGDPRRSQRLRSAIAAALASGMLPVRPHRRPPRRLAARRPGTGTVTLVGGGPGDPGLITVRGRRALAEADVVVADRLGPRELLDELDPDVEVIDAGKAPGAHSLTQDEINALLVDRALAGLRVVRLKGGDPFVFGRGGEEALACVRSGVPVAVVPGVTSAVAVPAAAGIPVTHRGIAQDFTVVSAHLDPAAPAATADWAAMGSARGTLVLLMAVAHLGAVAAELVRHGRDPATPVAIIQAGTTREQRVLTSTLARAGADCAAHAIKPPAVVVIGDVVRLGAELGSVLGMEFGTDPGALARHAEPAAPGEPGQRGAA